MDILYYDGYQVYNDISVEASEFDSTIEMEDGYIYIGNDKPLESIYIHSPVSELDSFSLSYSNGENWIELDTFDKTRNLSRSGIISWETPEDELEVEVDSVTQYWYQLDSFTSLKGLSTLFCSESDLVLEFPDIMSDTFLIGNQTSHINSLLAARDQILEMLSVKYEKAIQFSDVVSNYKNAAVYLSLHKIFRNASDKVDDEWSFKAAYYLSLFEKSFDNILIDEDRNDVVDVKTFKSIRMVR